AFNDATEHGITPALRGFRGMVEEGVIGDIDEELCGGRMRVHRAGHGDRADFVFKAVVGFVFDGGARGFLFHARLETAALDHEVIDHAMENRAVVMAGLDVFLKVRSGFRCLCEMEMQLGVAVICVERDRSEPRVKSEWKCGYNTFFASPVIPAETC